MSEAACKVFTSIADNNNDDDDDNNDDDDDDDRDDDDDDDDEDRISKSVQIVLLLKGSLW